MKKNNSMLQSARMKKSWTPEFVSQKVGVSLTTYMRWETGVQVPRPSSLSALCNVFEMSPAELGFAPASPDAQNTIPEAGNQGKAYAPGDQVTWSTPSEALGLWSLGITSCWQLYMVGGQVELERLVPNYLANLNKATLYPGPEQLI